MIRASLNGGREPGSMGTSGDPMPWATDDSARQYGRVQSLESGTAQSTPAARSLGELSPSGGAGMSSAAAFGGGGGGGVGAPLQQVQHDINLGNAYQQRALAGHAVGTGGGGGGGLGNVVKGGLGLKAAQKIKEKWNNRGGEEEGGAEAEAGAGEAGAAEAGGAAVAEAGGGAAAEAGGAAIGETLLEAAPLLLL